jgi:hypothetical protein
MNATRVNGALALYGFCVCGLDDPPSQIAGGTEAWPLLSLKRLPFDDRPIQPPGTTRVDDQRAELWIGQGTVADVDRASLSVRFLAPDRPSDALVIHPYLAAPACVAGHWLGRQAFHGGAFLHGDRAWGLLGSMQAGKSSTLAWLQRHGEVILTDDVLLVEHGVLFAGPRCLDLREAPALALGAEDLNTEVRPGRWRVPAGPSPTSASLGGFVHLEWGARVAMEPLGLVQRLELLSAHRTVLAPGQDPEAFLDLASLPAWRLVRPHDLSRMDEVVDQLLAVLD